MIDRDRTFHRLMAATRKKKAEDRHAREALAQDNFYPSHCRSQSPRFCGAKDRFSPALRKTHPLANTLKPEDLRPK